MSIQPMGLYSGQGGDLIAKEMLARQQQQGQKNNAFQSIMDNIPQLMQSAALAKYYGSLQAKADNEAKAQQYKAQVTEEAAREYEKLHPGKGIGSGIRAGLIEKESLNKQLESASADEGLQGVAEQWAGDNPDLAGKSQDPGFLKQAVAASNGDPTKLQAILKHTEENYEYSVVERNSAVAEDVLNQVTQNIQDPKITEIYKQSGIPPEAIPSRIVLNALKQHPELQKDPELKRILFKKFIGGGVPSLEDFAHKAGTYVYENEQRAANLGKIKSETNENNAQAGQASATAALRTEQIDTEGTKQVKNLRPPAARGSSGDKAAKDAEKKQAKLDDAASKLEVKIATEQGKGRKQNKVLLRTLQNQKRELDAKRGVKATTPKSFFESPQGKAFSNYLGVGK
jgi:hypothetical protein